MAWIGSDGSLTYDDVVATIADGRTPGLSQPWAVALARVVALQHDVPDHFETALSLLDSFALGTTDADAQALHALLLIETGRTAEALSFLDASPDTRYAELIALDALNPALGRATGDADGWARRLAEFYVTRGLAPISVADGAPTAFDGLTCDPGATVADGPLVSVAMTTFRPGQEIFASVRSILKQSWCQLELIVVDDASGPEYDEVLDHIESLDDRIRVVRLAVNGGTYLARNAALAVAEGRYVTGQDDDDWAHPQRIEAQMAPILRGGGRSSISQSLRATPDLRFCKPGSRLVATHLPSFLAERDVLRELGGYLPARKGADREIVERVRHATGHPAHPVDLPLSVYRLTASSLSRAEFGPGWAHPSRVAFWDLANRVHGQALAAGAPLATTVERLAVPQRFAVESRTPVLDIVLVADWESPAGVAHPLAHELVTLADAGLKVGALHLEDARRFSRGRTPLCSELLDLVNDRRVELVALDDAADVKQVVVADAGVLQVAPPGAATWHPREVVLMDAVEGVADAPRSVRTAFECHEHARWVFGVEPRWAGRTADARMWLRVELPWADVEDAAFPVIPSHLSGRPRVVRAGQQIVGAAMTQVSSKWAGALVGAARAGCDVRLLAPAHVLRSVRDAYPTLSEIAQASLSDVSIDEFARSLDLAVMSGAAGIVEHTFAVTALAAGVVPVVQRRPEGWPDRLGLRPAGAWRCSASVYSRQSAEALAYARGLDARDARVAWVRERLAEIG